jgi:hypothetical protein
LISCGGSLNVNSGLTPEASYFFFVWTLIVSEFSLYYSVYHVIAAISAAVHMLGLK